MDWIEETIFVIFAVFLFLKYTDAESTIRSLKDQLEKKKE